MGLGSSRDVNADFPAELAVFGDRDDRMLLSETPPSGASRYGMRRGLCYRRGRRGRHAAFAKMRDRAEGRQTG